MPATDQTTDSTCSPNRAGLGDAHGTEPTEVGRLMTVCNSCRYCEGLCAVFPAMIARRDFPDGDLNYMANLCHGCGACFYDCQFSPPHQFNVNVPRAMARARAESYQAYAWPRMFAGLFARNGLAISIIAALSGRFHRRFSALNDPSVLYGTIQGRLFYKLMPHNAMVALFGTVFLYAISRRSWARTGTILAHRRRRWRSEIPVAMKDGKLRYLDGGGADCQADENDSRSPAVLSPLHVLRFPDVLCRRRWRRCIITCWT